MKTAVIIGAGTMGSGIAHVCAQHGMNVRLLDADASALDRAIRTIRRNLDRQVQKGLIEAGDADAALVRIETYASIADHLAGGDIVIEAVSEKRAVKEEVFKAMDESADADALLASNTSSISITWLASRTGRAERVVGMHFFNPVPVMQLVEVVRGLTTSAETVERTVALARFLGKTPIVVNDAPGFVSNRVLMPMINEAAFCVMEGVADAEAVDGVMTLGMAHPMGPLALADLIGLDVCLDILEVLHRELGEDKYRPCPMLRTLVAAGRLGRKSGTGFYTYSQ